MYAEDSATALDIDVSAGVTDVDNDAELSFEIVSHTIDGGDDIDGLPEVLL